MPPTALRGELCGVRETATATAATATAAGGGRDHTNPAAPIPCTGAGCRVLISCDANLARDTRCTYRIRIFLPRSAVRLADVASEKARGHINFAWGMANIAPGANETVKLNLTSQGKRIVGTTTKRRLSGVMRHGDRKHGRHHHQQHAYQDPAQVPIEKALALLPDKWAVSRLLNSRRQCSPAMMLWE